MIIDTTQIEVDQYAIAEDLVEEIKKEIDRLKELSAAVVLDMMGILGVEFCIGDGASRAFLESGLDSLETK